MDTQDLKLREFDRKMQIEIARVRETLETEISIVQPLFGEETGEFVDFTKGSSNCARLQKFQIVEVKPPRLGDTHPSAVHANLTFTLKDHE